MGRLGTIARRTFLIGSAAVAGGVAFGVYTVRRDPANPLADGLADGAATFNPWVMIDSEKITLIAAHGDKGQGVWTAQAALIAEELDVELDQVEVSFGQPATAYWNTAMGGEGVPALVNDDSFGTAAMRTVMSSAMKLLGMQATGGSTAMPDSFVKLREAGAVARETLKLAAAQRTGVPADQLTTKEGAVHTPAGEMIAYTDLAAEAAAIEPVQSVTLRDPSEWRIIGKPFERLDMVGKSTGTLQYGIDIDVPGMLHATVCTNPFQGGALNGFDASVAETMPGVKKIVEVTNGVAVVADNTWRAMQAMNTIEFDWAQGPYPPNQEEHWAVLDASFNEEQLDSEWRNEGDVLAAAAAGSTVDVEYRSPYVAHQPLEPLNATVLVEDDKTTIWTGHQIQRQVQIEVAAIVGIEQDQVIFPNQFMGGSFGHRLEFEHIKQATEIANQMRGTPVKMTYTREEDFAHDFPRHIGMARGTGSYANGQVTGLDLQIATPSVITSQMGRIGLSLPGPDSQIAAGSWNNPYFEMGNMRVRAYRSEPLAPVSSWRAVGANGAGFFFDTLLDETIHAAGADPLEERIRLMGHDGSRKVLEAVGEMSSWNGPLGNGKGRGVSFVESFGVPVAEIVEVSLVDGAIKIDNVWIAADVGKVIDPLNFENLVQGGVIFGLGHAINSEITYKDGLAEQSNYHVHEAMRLYQTPEIFVRGLENQDHVRGIGEPPVPPAAPALGNAIFAATGQRLREMPFNKFVDFV